MIGPNGQNLSFLVDGLADYGRCVWYRSLTKVETGEKVRVCFENLSGNSSSNFSLDGLALRSVQAYAEDGTLFEHDQPWPCDLEVKNSRE